MAAPTFVAAAAGGTNPAAPGSIGISGPTWAADDIMLVQCLQDGGSAGLTLSVASWAKSISGTTSSYTTLGPFAVGASGEALQHIFLIRLATAPTGALNFDGYSSEDIYARAYQIQGVSTSTTLGDVIEQNGTTTPSSTSGTGTTISDAGVTTTGADRLVVNLVGVNDDNALDAFTGMTGGTWAEAVAEYAESTGTDGAVQLQTATLASAGTIDGGTLTMAASDAWGVVGFALKPPAAAAPASLLLPNRSNRVVLRQR